MLFVLEPAEKGRDEELHRNHSAESTPIAGGGFRTLRAHSIKGQGTFAFLHEHLRWPVSGERVQMG